MSADKEEGPPIGMEFINGKLMVVAYTQEGADLLKKIMEQPAPNDLSSTSTKRPLNK